MMENAISSSSLYGSGSTLNYSQAAMMGLTSSHGSLQDTQQLGYSSHSGIPNIILTGEAASPVTGPVPRSLGGASLCPGAAWPLGEAQLQQETELGCLPALSPGFSGTGPRGGQIPPAP